MNVERNKNKNQVQASDALPLPIRHTNKLFSFVFLVSLSFLMPTWREKISNSTPLHLLTLSEMIAALTCLSSVIYLISFFGIDYVQSFISDPSHDDEEEQELNLAQHIATSVVNPDTKVAIVDRITSADFPLEDQEIINSVISGKIPSHSLEKELDDTYRAVKLRREAIKRITGRGIEGLPMDGFDYNSILGQCCELPIGYVQVPVGIAGPLVLDGVPYYVPMATTEGCLVASTNRGCKAIAASGGATSVVYRDGMSRAPVVRFGSAARAAELMSFLEEPANFDTLAHVFNRTSRFGRLQEIQCTVAGRNLYIRFNCRTGDAMGMNMVSKGVQNVLEYLQSYFPDMEVISISGNYCSDKKASAINWIKGRGKSVVCEAIIKEETVKKVLKTNVEALIDLNTRKNLVGSAMAGALGGFNAQASNIVSAVFIATGQDPAQNVESSHCITMMEAMGNGKDLYISVTMPCIEVGTVGGGTQLRSQSACLELLGVRGANMECPGANASLLSTIVAGAVLAGELSLMSALVTGELVNSHMRFNRSSRAPPPPPPYDPNMPHLIDEATI